MRAFLAIDVDATSSPEQPVVAPTHLTLRFLGDVPPESVSGLVAAIRPVGRHHAPFSLVLAGVDAFPSRSAPRVVWVGVTDGRDAVVRLAGDLADALATVGVPPEPPPFVPHVTLFRVRSAADRDRALGLLRGLDPSPAPRAVAVREFSLKESTLTPGGALHRTLERFPLTGARGAAG